MNLNLVFFTLSDTNWRTAEATGALALMRYQEVKDFAGYYDVQSMLNRLMNSLEDTWLDMTAAFNPVGGTDVSKMDDRQLDEVQRRVQLALGRLVAVENVAQALDNFYNQKLNQK